MARNRIQGFTLIELLVVIAIIGMLSAIILASLNQSRNRSYDARRKSDMHMIQVALGVYYSNHGGYPSTGSTGATDSSHYANSNPANDASAVSWLQLFNPLVSEGAMPYVPRDPINIPSGQFPWGATPAPRESMNQLYHYRADGTAGTDNGAHYLLCGWLNNTDDPINLGHRDLHNPFNPSQFLSADVGYSKYNYCVGE